MKKYRILIIMASLFFMTSFGYAQSADIQKLAQERVSSIEAEIVAGNPVLALSIEQRQKIKALHIKRTTQIREIRGSDLAEGVKNEKVKAEIKAFNQALIQEILSKEQSQARRDARGAGNKG